MLVLVLHGAVTVVSLLLLSRSLLLSCSHRHVCIIICLSISFRSSPFLAPFSRSVSSLPLKPNRRSFFTDWTLNTERENESMCVCLSSHINFLFWVFLFAHFVCTVVWVSWFYFICNVSFGGVEMRHPLILFSMVALSFVRSLLPVCMSYCMCHQYVTLLYFYFYFFMLSNLYLLCEWHWNSGYCYYSMDFISLLFPSLSASSLCLTLVR